MIKWRHSLESSPLANDWCQGRTQRNQGGGRQKSKRGGWQGATKGMRVMRSQRLLINIPNLSRSPASAIRGGKGEVRWVQQKWWWKQWGKKINYSWCWSILTALTICQCSLLHQLVCICFCFASLFSQGNQHWPWFVRPACLQWLLVPIISTCLADYHDLLCPLFVWPIIIRLMASTQARPLKVTLSHILASISHPLMFNMKSKATSQKSKAKTPNLKAKNQTQKANRKKSKAKRF